MVAPACPCDGLMVLGAKNEGSLVVARKLAFFVSCGTGQPCATTGKLGTEHWTAIGAHTAAGRQCADIQRQALVLMGWHVYAWVQDAEALGRRKLETGLST